MQVKHFFTDLGHLREVWIEPGAAQPLCRRDHSAVVHNNLMYVYGGFMDCGGASQELWAFNIGEKLAQYSYSILVQCTCFVGKTGVDYSPEWIV